jgi:hypothetical protein
MTMTLTPVDKAYRASCTAASRQLRRFSGIAIGVLRQLTELGGKTGMSVPALRTVLGWPGTEIRNACEVLRTMGLIEGTAKNFVITTKGRTFWRNYETVFGV